MKSNRQNVLYANQDLCQEFYSFFIYYKMCDYYIHKFSIMHMIYSYTDRQCSDYYRTKWHLPSENNRVNYLFSL